MTESSPEWMRVKGAEIVFLRKKKKKKKKEREKESGCCELENG